MKRNRFRMKQIAAGALAVLLMVQSPILALADTWKAVRAGGSGSGSCYKITYALDGGTNNPKNPSVYTTGKTVMLHSPSRDGSTFDGWYSDREFQNKVSRIPRGSKENKKFYAKWVSTCYTIRFNGNGATSGSMSDISDCERTASYKLAENMYQRTGYTFTGWNTKADGSGTAYANGAYLRNPSSIDNDTVTLYAQWSVDPTMPAVPESSETESTEAEHIETESAEMESTETESTETERSETDSVESPVTNYKICFSSNGGTGSMNPITATYGVAVTLPVCTMKNPGKQFVGWNTEPDGRGISFDAGDSVGNLTDVGNLTYVNGVIVTLYAMWRAESDWTPASQVPSGATVLERKWKYTKVEETTSDTVLPGWTVTGEEWQKTGGGSSTYADFPSSGYYYEDPLYSTYSESSVEPFENETTKRVVGTPERTSHIYWHWTNTKGKLKNDVYDCWVNNRSGEENGRNYWNFVSFESAENYGHTDPRGKTLSDVYYAWRNRPDDGSWWWYEIPIYTVTYEDYEKVYQLEKRTEMESDTEVMESDTVTDVQEYVRYFSK